MEPRLTPPALLMLKISCADLERSRAFYGELGFEPNGEAAVADAPWLATLYGVASAKMRVQRLRAPDGASAPGLELLEWAAPAKSAAASIDTPGCAALSFRANDLAATVGRLVAAGGQIAGSIAEVSSGRARTRLVNVTDPDGLTLQLVEIRRSGPQ